jgi:hypothetical protein
MDPSKSPTSPLAFHPTVDVPVVAAVFVGNSTTFVSFLCGYSAGHASLWVEADGLSFNMHRSFTIDVAGVGTVLGSKCFCCCSDALVLSLTLLNARRSSTHLRLCLVFLDSPPSSTSTEQAQIRLTLTSKEQIFNRRCHDDLVPP